MISKSDNSSKGEKTLEQLTASENRGDAHEDAEVEKVVRKSTRTSVVVRQAERDAIRAALQATMKVDKVIIVNMYYLEGKTFTVLHCC